jgi:nitroreductase
MEFRDVVRRRRMVRNYDPDRPVPPEIRDRILEHAIHAPSAGFSQGWGFLVLEEPADRERFWAAATPRTDVWQEWLTNMRHAPLIIVAHSNRNVYLDRYAERDKGWTDRDEARWPCRTGTSMPASPACSCCSRRLMRASARASSDSPGAGTRLSRRVRCATRLHRDRSRQCGLQGEGSPVRFAQAWP